MSMLSTSTLIKDVGLNANLRPNSINVIGQQPNLFPFDAFVFEDPNTTETPSLGMAEGWTFDIGTVKLENLSDDLSEALEQASILAEDNALKIKNTDGQVLITGEVVDILATELNLEGETINITADKLVIYNPSDSSETEQLSEVLKIESGNIYFGDYTNGAGMQWNQSGQTLDIRGDLTINSDSAGRYLSLGSNGLYVEDANSVVIHDLPSQPVVTGGSYCGHLIYSNGSDSSNYLLNTTTTSSSWVTLTCNTYSNSNVKAVLLNVYIKSNMIVGGSTHLSSYVGFRPYGSSWNFNVASLTDPVPVVCVDETSSGVYLNSVNTYSTVIVPADSSGRIQFNFPGGYGDVQTLRVFQLGIFI